jgi:hypothetical protein
MRARGFRGVSSLVLVVGCLAGAGAGAGAGAMIATAASAAAARCPAMLAPALAADARPHALRVFAIQFRQDPASIVTAADYVRAIDCVMRNEVAPHVAKGRPNLVVFDEDIGLEAIGAGPRGATARALLRHGVSSCAGQAPPCATIETLLALNGSYGKALAYLEPRFPGLAAQLGKSFVAATDQFVRVFMTTMATEARRYGVYVIASSTQAPFRLTRDPAAVAALHDPATPKVTAVYAPTEGRAYNQTFVWGPHVLDNHKPVALANLMAVNRKVPLTAFEVELGFANGPTSGPAAIANLRPVRIPGTGARLGIATSLPAFTYGDGSHRPAQGHECDDVTKSYVRCLDRLGANVLVQADANDGQWSGADADPSEQWQPLSWMGSAWRAVHDPTVHFTYAVNPFMVGNLADTPFDGQSAILERGRRGNGCHYVGNASFVSGKDRLDLRADTGSKPEFLALAPWAVADGPRSRLVPVGNALAAGTGRVRYVQTAVIADLTFPAEKTRRGCVIAGRR